MMMYNEPTKLSQRPAGRSAMLALAALGFLACGGVEDPGETGPDAGDQVNPPDAADPGTPDAGDCLPGYTGPDCTDCAAEWHDVVGDGTCTPTCEATGAYARNCGDHGTCVVDENNGDRLCECDEGHEGFSCENCLDGYELDGDGACQLALPSTSGMALWLDADHDSSLVLEGGAVASWRDRRGDAFPAVAQLVVADRPFYLVDGMNGRPVVHFDGASSLKKSNFAGLKGANYTIFLVFGPPQDSSNGTIFRAADTNNTFLTFERVLAGSRYRVSHNGPPTGDASDVVTSSAVSNSDKSFVIHRFTSGQTDSMRIITNQGIQADDEVVNTALTQPAINSPHNFYLGDTSVVGDLAELIIYDRSVLPTELANIQAYLAAKWNIQ